MEFADDRYTSCQIFWKAQDILDIISSSSITHLTKSVIVRILHLPDISSISGMHCVLVAKRVSAVWLKKPARNLARTQVSSFLPANLILSLNHENNKKVLLTSSYCYAKWKRSTHCLASPIKRYRNYRTRVGWSLRIYSVEHPVA